MSQYEYIDIIKAIPSAYEDKLIVWRDQRSNDCWWLGDTTIIIIAWIEENNARIGGKPIGRMDIYNAIGRLSGVAGRTVRYYAAICEFYPHDQRELYEVLPFSHFAFARQFDERAGEILSAALDYIEGHGGRPPSVEWLEYEFIGKGKSSTDITIGPQTEYVSDEANTDNPVIREINRIQTMFVDLMTRVVSIGAKEERYKAKFKSIENHIRKALKELGEIDN
jgi:hypothetical protein